MHTLSLCKRQQRQSLVGVGVGIVDAEFEFTRLGVFGTNATEHASRALHQPAMRIFLAWYRSSSAGATHMSPESRKL